MALKRGDNGPEVKRLQTALLELGYDLPRWGADGDLGAETVEAFSRFLAAHSAGGDEDANTISDPELALVYSVLANVQSAPLGPKLPSGRFHDLRASAAQTTVGGKRSWKQITGIVLHQTAAVMGEKPARYNTLGAHLGATRAGQVVWVHDFDKVIWHANGFNGFTVGLECDGTYEGVEGDSRTFWRPKEEPNRQPQSPTPELVEAAKATIRWVCQEVARHGGKISLLVAHRQSSGDRESDPGSALWQKVAMPLHKELGLTDGGPSYKTGTGLLIPERWDSSRVGIKYQP